MNINERPKNAPFYHIQFNEIFESNRTSEKIPLYKTQKYPDTQLFLI